MENMPARLIVQVFTKAELSEKEVSKLRAQIAEGIEAQGRRLVDLVIDRGPPKRDPAEHESLVRIARGDADGIALFTFPLKLSPKKSADVLGSHLKGPWLSLTAAELADRGLLPGGTRYQPERKKKDLAAQAVGTPQPIWAAAARAAQLRGQHPPMSFRKIAEHLEAEGFRPARGGKWFAHTVGQLLKRSEPVRVNTHAGEARTH